MFFSARLRPTCVWPPHLREDAERKKIAGNCEEKHSRCPQRARIKLRVGVHWFNSGARIQGAARPQPRCIWPNSSSSSSALSCFRRTAWPTCDCRRCSSSSFSGRASADVNEAHRRGKPGRTVLTASLLWVPAQPEQRSQAKHVGRAKGAGKRRAVRPYAPAARASSAGFAWPCPPF